MQPPARFPRSKHPQTYSGSVMTSRIRSLRIRWSMTCQTTSWSCPPQKSIRMEVSLGFVGECSSFDSLERVFVMKTTQNRLGDDSTRLR